MHKGMGEYIGNPVPHYRLSSAGEWDSIKLDKFAGHYMLSDKHGVGLNRKDRKDGMLVKIRAKRAHWSGYEYLQSDTRGKYLRHDGNRKAYV